MGNNWFYYRNTQSVCLKLKKDLNLINLLVDLFIQIFFIGYYTLSIVLHHDNIGFLIFYIIFLVLSVAYLIYYIVTYKKKKEKLTKRVKAIIKYSKYALRPIFFVITFIDIFKNNGSDLQKMLTIISIVCYFLQIAINLLIAFGRKYIDLFIESIKMDYDSSDAIKALINSRRYPQPKVKEGIGDKILKTALSKVDNFVTNNKDSAPKVELTEKQLKLRGEIEEYKKQFVPEAKENEETDVNFDDIDLSNDTNAEQTITDEVVEGKKKGIFGFFKSKK